MFIAFCKISFSFWNFKLKISIVEMNNCLGRNHLPVDMLIQKKFLPTLSLPTMSTHLKLRSKLDLKCPPIQVYVYQVHTCRYTVPGTVYLFYAFIKCFYYMPNRYTLPILWPFQLWYTIVLFRTNSYTPCSTWIVLKFPNNGTKEKHCLIKAITMYKSLNECLIAHTQP